ncbi:MAG: nucleoside deaminase [Telmatospirillum sp.]|nr:nucleoside deaminase [Telmatospirillum sp.]
MYDEKFMRRAIEISRTAIDIPGAEPFGAVVVQDGVIVGEGLNRAAALMDPTSHGEVEAIRDACRKLGTRDLSACELYTSCEPCTLCVATMHIVGISALYYAASLSQSWNALKHLGQHVRRYTISAVDLRTQCGLPVDQRKMPASTHLAEVAIPAIDAWATSRAG